MTLLLVTLQLHKIYHIVENIKHEKLTRTKYLLRKCINYVKQPNILLSSSFSELLRMFVNYFLMSFFLKFIFRCFVVTIEK